MCGIAGVIDASPGAPLGLEPHLRVLRHRGPDSEGVHVGRGAAVGQTRLAVIDLVTGDPPITDEDGQIGVALNGEIYNYQSLRKHLLEEGHRLRSQGDTEVIAHLAEDAEPVEVARRLDGMFAFAIWDDRRHTLVLGRDRLGKKPLYYWDGGGRFVFGSEIKAILADPVVAADLDPDVIPAYLTFGYVPTPRTFFRGVRSLPPGHVLVREANGTVRVQRYWEPPVPDAPLDVSLDEAAALVRRGLADAVSRRLIADVPLGAFLSGGVDSSAIVALMSELSDAPVRTFSIGFEDTAGFDERPYARQVARRFGTEHTEFVVQPDATQLIERLVWHYDQPFGDSSSLPTFLLAELTRGHVTVALSGDGGDELFAGYERMAAGLALGHLHRLPRPARRTLRATARLVPRQLPRAASLRRFLRVADDDLPRAYLSWVAYVPDEWRDALLPTGSDWATRDYVQQWQDERRGSTLERLLMLNLSTYLLDDLLPKIDRMSMAHALEVRSPFLDTELLQLALALPDSARVHRFTLKRVLKRAMADLLPPEILDRPKRGFGVPLGRWFRTDLRGYVDSRLCSTSSRVRAHVDGTALDALVAEHHSCRADHGHSLWTLLTLDVFLRDRGW